MLICECVLLVLKIGVRIVLMCFCVLCLICCMYLSWFVLRLEVDVVWVSRFLFWLMIVMFLVGMLGMLDDIICVIVCIWFLLSMWFG